MEWVFTVIIRVSFASAFLIPFTFLILVKSNFSVINGPRLLCPVEKTAYSKDVKIFHGFF